MCVCLANGNISYLCRVAFATYILKGRFSDAHTDLAKSGKFFKSGYVCRKAFRHYGRGLLFPYPLIAVYQSLPNEIRKQTRSFFVLVRSNRGCRKTGRVGKEND